MKSTLCCSGAFSVTFFMATGSTILGPSTTGAGTGGGGGDLDHLGVVVALLAAALGRVERRDDRLLLDHVGVVDLGGDLDRRIVGLAAALLRLGGPLLDHHLVVVIVRREDEGDGAPQERQAGAAAARDEVDR